ncbi:hypothetical protein [Bradyrhizobium uaiense]|uniref:Uncharacterized protein n=1 Tax=Bradyrhizobium uaiense TaxID=2594946 RepID=A0A6P1BNB7_9BRAD|nr:hypothetical protein [Bradyrhizobium uaiense]NEU99689.1 hypothetical protein [Bradyrhizobium uaiense]
MRKIAAVFLFGIFCCLIGYAGGERLYHWTETGQLAVHRKMFRGADFVSYDSDRVGFLLEFGLNFYLLKMGLFGMLMACREMWLRAQGWEP